MQFLIYDSIYVELNNTALTSSRVFSTFHPPSTFNLFRLHINTADINPDTEIEKRESYNSSSLFFILLHLLDIRPRDTHTHKYKPNTTASS